MSETKRTLGWLRDMPDFHDYTVRQKNLATRAKDAGQKQSILAMLEEAGVTNPAKVSLPPSIDLKDACSPIEDQGSLGSCTAQAAIGLVEYFERRAFGRHIDASRLFTYKTTRNLLHLSGDTGAYLRTTMASLVLFGVPPEEYWPYTDRRPAEAVVPTYHFDLEPPAFCYAYAQNYQAIQYYRLDSLGTTPDALLLRIKAHLAAKLPSMFGFAVFSSIAQADTNGCIPFPTTGERILGGHAVDAVGYDDLKEISNANPGGPKTKGALLIRNSWGKDWGQSGYGWLPYEYVLKGLAVDWWSLLRNEWIDTGQFKA